MAAPKDSRHAGPAASAARGSLRLGDHRLVAAAVFTLGLTKAGPAGAVDCSRLPSPVYVTGSPSTKPLFAAVAKILIAQNPPATLIYYPQESCSALDSLLNAAPVFNDAGPFTTWSLTGIETACDVTLGAIADVAVSDVFFTTCFALPGGMPAAVGDFWGPIQTMTFVVPKSSPERSISAEAAYYVYGFGSSSGVFPWTNEPWIFRRNDQAGSQRLVAAAIGVDPTRWKGTVATSDNDMLAKVTVAGTGGQTIGVLPADIAQSNRGIVNVLAYQHFDQTCGYYPDRDATSNDKINVRDGHYALWGPLHLFARVGSGGLPASSLAAQVIGYVTGTKAAPSDTDWIALEAQAHLIPKCAMRVNRTTELGPLSSFASPSSCGCYFEKIANGVSTCRPCVTAGDCSSATALCSHGYCESQ